MWRERERVHTIEHTNLAVRLRPWPNIIFLNFGGWLSKPGLRLKPSLRIANDTNYYYPSVLACCIRWCDVINGHYIPILKREILAFSVVHRVVASYEMIRGLDRSRIIDWPRGQINAPLLGVEIVPFFPVRNSLFSVSSPWRVFWADSLAFKGPSTWPCALLPELQR